MYYLLVILLVAMSSSSDCALIGPNNPTFGNDYFALDNMAYGRPTKFFNFDYQRYMKDNNDEDDIGYDEDNDFSKSKRRYRPSLYKRRYLPATKLLGQDIMKRALFGLWKPAQLVGKVNRRQVIEIELINVIFHSNYHLKIVLK